MSRDMRPTTEILEIIRKELNEGFGKNFWDPVTPEEMSNIAATYRKAIDSYLESLGYGKPLPYTVICDERNNSPEDIENGVINVTIIPPPTLDKIPVEFLLINEDKENGFFGDGVKFAATP